MSITMSAFSIIFGLFFMVMALGKNTVMEPNPVEKMINNKSGVYDGIITAIEENEQGQRIKIEYEKDGQRAEALFYSVNMPDSTIDFKFNFSVGTKVSFNLSENGNINLMTIHKKEEAKASATEEKGKIQWGLLFFGMLLFAFGVYSCIQNIYWLLFIT